MVEAAQGYEIFPKLIHTSIFYPQPCPTLQFLNPNPVPTPQFVILFLQACPNYLLLMQPILVYLSSPVRNNCKRLNWNLFYNK